ncbi:L-threonylcarbamoyladenylate synthase [Thermobacillus sp. ZCTH02-B1]|uniref:L-threonylcarbamoyladenylate synthase n=1 Tax=Thermobacillus sp. ZCTH02-B1 TaxID=1858795 RepID=UPI0025F04B19|nr:L-threonylcarbamoyladenylate synthase [Thermobacillus sp. ZCTH02-B1]
MNGKTKLWGTDDAAIAEAARTLREGGIVAFPTETVYGLGADARNAEAVRRVFAAKGRPSDNPLIVHIADRDQLRELALPYGGVAARLMDAFWPGPLTIVLPVRPGAVAPEVTAGLDTVAVRMPAHPVALRLIAAAGCPIAAPSANRSGRPSPTLAAHVLEDLEGRIDGVVDGGPAEVGLESTVVMMADGRIHVLRPGGVTPEALAEAAGCEVAVADVDGVAVAGNAGSGAGGGRGLPDGGKPAAGLRSAGPGVAPEGTGAGAAPRSPGMKYAHYAPRGEMTLVIGDRAAVRGYIGREAAAARAAGCRTGVLTWEEHAGFYDADAVVVCGSLARPGEAAQRLYAALRSFDARGIDRIWAEGCPPEGIGLALMNRLAKAAGGRIVRV